MPQAANQSQFDLLYEQLEQLPASITGQIVNGQLHTSPRPSGPHGLVTSILGMDIGAAYHRGRNGPGGWWIIDEPECHLPTRDVCVPDIAGWRRETMPAIPQDHRFVVVPDWVCEVISPSTANLDRAEKLPLYAHCGVAHLWLIDPIAKTVEILQLVDGNYLLLHTCGGNGAFSAPPFDAISIDMTALWQTTGDPR
jgi:Uma2 family endonuclease